MKQLTANKLKWVAVIAMLTDHIAWLWVETNTPTGIITHTVGRLTAPIMFYLLVEGYHHTKNYWAYVRRLTLLAIISHAPYSLYTNTLNTGHPTITIAPTSVITTLLIALLTIKLYDTLRKYGQHHTLIPIIIIASIPLAILADWGGIGVIIALVFHALKNSNRKWGVYMLTIVAYTVWLHATGTPLIGLLPIMLGTVPFILLINKYYNGEKGKTDWLNKWAFYIIYPTHLLALTTVWAIMN